MTIAADKVLDAKGLACPMPIVKTKKTMQELNAGQVLEVQATDKGSLADLQAWAKSTGQEYIGTITEGDVLKHYLRKSTGEEEKEEKKFPNVAELAELKTKLEQEENIAVLDVREPAEYAFGHIPGAISIPLGELEAHVDKLDKDKQTYIICRTGSRSDMAAQQLAEKGFSNIKNVIPGMKEWDGQLVESKK